MKSRPGELMMTARAGFSKGGGSQGGGGWMSTKMKIFLFCSRSRGVGSEGLSLEEILRYSRGVSVFSQRLRYCIVQGLCYVGARAIKSRRFRLRGDKLRCGAVGR